MRYVIIIAILIVSVLANEIETKIDDTSEMTIENNDSSDTADSIVDTQAIAPVISDRNYPKPHLAAMFSGIVPGGGQFYNKKYIKSAVFLGAQTTLALYAVDYHKKAQDAYSLRNVYERGSPEYLQARDTFEKNVDNRNLTLWIIVAVHLVNILDAYVDAHLAPFSDEMEAEIAVIPHNNGAKVVFGGRFSLFGTKTKK